MPPTKPRERLMKFMISISLSEKFCCQNPTTSTKATNMTRNSSKSNKSRKENPQKLTQLSSRSHPRHLVGKRPAQKDTIIDITSDSQLFLYLYITWITINNNTPHLKSPKNQNRRAALGRPAIKITGGLELVCGRPTLVLSSALAP